MWAPHDSVRRPGPAVTSASRLGSRAQRARSAGTGRAALGAGARRPHRRRPEAKLRTGGATARNSSGAGGGGGGAGGGGGGGGRPRAGGGGAGGGGGGGGPAPAGGGGADGAAGAAGS